MCTIFTLTVTCQAKNRCLSLPVASIHSWYEFSIILLHAFQDYYYDKVCLELDNLSRFEGESFEDFLTRFKLICLEFQSQDLPSEIELMGWFRHIFSLPCISNNHDEPKYINFLSLFTIVDDSFETTSDMANLVQTHNLEIVNEFFLGKFTYIQ
jgi:hypothetical protein